MPENIPGSMEEKLNALEKLEEIIERLRGPDGCPWDQNQTLKSLSKNFLEEACEVIDAIDDSSTLSSDSRFETNEAEISEAAICEELGDLLMNILLAARIAEETNGFDLADVAERVAEKLVRRHPHVFGDERVANEAEVLERWKSIKAEEKPISKQSSILDQIPRSLPPLTAAFELDRKAAKTGFDWPSPLGAMDKIREEIQEVETIQPLNASESENLLKHEIGDLLLAVVNFSRKVGISPDMALREANQRFRFRFYHVEKFINKEKSSGNKTPNLQEMEKRWQQAKLLE